MYFRNKIPKDLSEIKEEDTDLRLRITNGAPEVVIKKGLFTGSHSRKEVSIDFPIEKIQDFIDFLLTLGWHLGVIYATEKFDYKYKDIEFSLVEIYDYGYNFEVECLLDTEGVENAKKKLSSVLDELKLNPFNENELNKQCNEINNKKELHFDFSKESFNEIKEKISKFF